MFPILAYRFHRSMTRPFFNKERITDFDIFDRHALDAISQAQQRLKAGFPIDFQVCHPESASNDVDPQHHYRTGFGVPLHARLGYRVSLWTGCPLAVRRLPISPRITGGDSVRQFTPPIESVLARIRRGPENDRFPLFLRRPVEGCRDAERLDEGPYAENQRLYQSHLERSSSSEEGIEGHQGRPFPLCGGGEYARTSRQLYGR